MNTIIISATKARNTFFSLLDKVASGTEVIMKKDDEEVAVLSPKQKKTNWKALLKATKETAGILKDYEYDPEDNPLRRKGAADFLGKWDKDLIKKKRLLPLLPWRSMAQL